MHDKLSKRLSVAQHVCNLSNLSIVFVIFCFKCLYYNFAAVLLVCSAHSSSVVLCVCQSWGWSSLVLSLRCIPFPSCRRILGQFYVISRWDNKDRRWKTIHFEANLTYFELYRWNSKSLTEKSNKREEGNSVTIFTAFCDQLISQFCHFQVQQKILIKWNLTSVRHAYNVCCSSFNQGNVS